MYDMGYVRPVRKPPCRPSPEEVTRFKEHVAEALASEAACAECQAMKAAGPEGLEAVEWAEGSGSRPPVCEVHRTLRFYTCFPSRDPSGRSAGTLPGVRPSLDTASR